MRGWFQTTEQGLLTSLLAWRGLGGVPDLDDEALVDGRTGAAGGLAERRGRRRMGVTGAGVVRGDGDPVRVAAVESPEPHSDEGGTSQRAATFRASESEAAGQQCGQPDSPTVRTLSEGTRRAWMCPSNR